MFRIALVLPILFSLFSCWEGYGQDPQFSQFFATRIYLNPAFAGNTHWGRFSTHYRRQWPGLGGYTSYGAYYDHNLWKINSGLGVSVFQDYTHLNALSYTKLAVMYAYDLAVSRRLFMRFGIESSFNTLRVDLNKFTFTDQLLSGSSATTDRYSYEQRTVPDFAVGTVAYMKKWWVGLSVSHLNNFGQTGDERYNPSPLKLSTQGGVTLPVVDDRRNKRKHNVTFAAHYKAQEKFDQLDVGSYYAFTHVMTGVWYRGLPLKNNDSEQINADAIVLLFGLRYEAFRIAYNYDITISRLFGNSGGSHEVSVQVELGRNKKRRRKLRSSILAPCPDF